MLKNEKAQEGLKNEILLPDILREILDLFKGLYVNIPERVILNILITKIAHMITSKWITFDESGNINIPNWYSMIFINSGGGKDKIVRDFDKIIFADYLKWFNDNAESIYIKQLQEQTDETQIESKKVVEDNKKGENNNGKISNPF